MDFSILHDPCATDDEHNRSELDSHGDTCVAGANTLLLYFTEHKVSVSPFIGEYSPLQNVPIATVATAWDDPRDGSTILLIINEALYFGDRMSHSLLCPNQMRDNGIIVNDCPNIYDSSSSHSIIIPGVGIDLPLYMRGTISYLDTRRPTDDELLKCERFELTSAAPWNPNFAPGTDWEDSFREVQAFATIKPFESITPPEFSQDLLSRFINSVHIQASEPTTTTPPVCHEADVITHAGDVCRELSALNATSRSTVVTNEELARRWFTGLESASRTLLVTTQEGMRFVEGDLERRLRTSKARLRFPTLNCVIYTDTLFAKCRSVRGYTCAQVFTDGRKFFRIFPMLKKSDAHHALTQFIQDVGIPRNCLVDRAPEERLGEWGRIISHYKIKLRTTEAHSPWQNRAEAGIRDIKKLVGRALRYSGAPVEFWCYAVEWAARITSLIAHDLPALKTRTPEEAVTGRTPDISEFAHYSWFEWVWYRDQASFPEPKICLGRWVGVAGDVGQAMTYWILTSQCTVIARSSVIRLQDYELRDPLILSQQEQFTTQLHERKRLSLTLEEPFVTVDDKEEVLSPDEEETIYKTPEMDEYTPESFDEYLSAQVTLPVGDRNLRGEVIRRRRDRNGRPIGIRNANPILDTREYDVLFPDGITQSYSANVIAENLYSQVDTEGRSFSL